MATGRTQMDRLRADPRVEFVDDERALGNSIIVTMREGWTLDARDPHNGVFGADTWAEAWATLRTAVKIADDCKLCTDDGDCTLLCDMPIEQGTAA